MNPHKFFRLARRPSVSLHSPATTLRLPLKITPFASFWCALCLFDPNQAHTNTETKIKRVSHSFSQNTFRLEKHTLSNLFPSCEAAANITNQLHDNDLRYYYPLFLRRIPSSWSSKSYHCWLGWYNFTINFCWSLASWIIKRFTTSRKSWWKMTSVCSSALLAFVMQSNSNIVLPSFSTRCAQYQNLLDDICRCAEKFLAEAAKYGEVRTSEREFTVFYCFSYLYSFGLRWFRSHQGSKEKLPPSCCWCQSPHFQELGIFKTRRGHVLNSRSCIRSEPNCCSYLTVMCSQIWRPNDIRGISRDVDVLKGFGGCSS